MRNRGEMRHAVTRGLAQDALDQHAIHRAARQTLPTVSPKRTRRGPATAPPAPETMGFAINTNQRWERRIESGPAARQLRIRLQSAGGTRAKKRTRPWAFLGSDREALAALARRALSTARPPRDFMRTRNPCVRLRLTTEG